LTQRININDYQVSESFYDFINIDVLPGTDLDQVSFWKSFTNILTEFTPRNKQLLEFRRSLQTKIDAWHCDPKNKALNQINYQTFLTEIGYLVPEGSDFKITTENVDAEIATIAGPQLVVPLMNARFALNAANARWGSLYDALYGTDVIPSDNSDTKRGYDPVRGRQVTDYAKDFLNHAVALRDASHSEVIHYFVDEDQLQAKLKSGHVSSLNEPENFAGYQGTLTHPTAILLKNNGLHIEIQMDTNNVIAQADAAGVSDIILESALTTIQDCEDSIAAVNAEDKISVYRNWLGLMKGNLRATFTKKGQQITRKLNPDREYFSANGQPMRLSGRSLQFIRNVGHLMTNNIILTKDNQEVPEGIVDAVITSLIALHDLNSSTIQNSKKSSIYIVKPKMHGPEEIKFCTELFSSVEECLGLPQNTIKMGIMDEERRTSANLKECIRQAKHRVVFINTGFLDRTGDEIHTSMQAGPMTRKELMKYEKWISVYEQRNVRIGLQAGFKGKAQIGKGMWAVPDLMSAMLDEKIGHLKAGANCAWVPSPTAATLHALHYHQLKVSTVQDSLLLSYQENFERKHDELTDLTDLLTIPLLQNRESLTDKEIQDELDNNVQGLLGYVVRWVDQGIGCSTVPDINNIGRMEDRATLRISSQHVCNWLHHQIINKAQVVESLKRMATIVDEQNSQDPNYQSMADDFESNIAFRAASDLIFKGKEQPSGYTEPLLHKARGDYRASK